MKRFRLNTGLIVASWALLLVFGCHKKRPQIPPEQEPPTILSQIPTEPTQTTEPQNPPSTQENQTASTTPPEKPPNTRPKHPKAHPAPKKIVVEADEPATTPATTEEAKNIPPPRVVIQEGGTNSGTGQASNGATKDNNSANQATTQQLLDGTENNLKNIKRQLSADEQSMVTQIRDWIKQSKDATKDGDDVRAYNLALKAHKFSDELVKAQ